VIYFFFFAFLECTFLLKCSAYFLLYPGDVFQTFQDSSVFYCW